MRILLNSPGKTRAEAFFRNPVKEAREFVASLSPKQLKALKESAGVDR